MGVMGVMGVICNPNPTDPHTQPRTGWSMMKSVHAILIGAAEHQGILGPLGIHRPVALADFARADKEDLFELNGRKNVTFADLIRMADVLRIAENYAIHKVRIFAAHMFDMYRCR